MAMVFLALLLGIALLPAEIIAPATLRAGEKQLVFLGPGDAAASPHLAGGPHGSRQVISVSTHDSGVDTLIADLRSKIVGQHSSA